MQYSTLLYTFLFTSPVLTSASVLAFPSPSLANLEPRQNPNCGDKNGKCDKNGCNGVNDPNGGLGVCLSGDYAGCPCESVCGGAVNACDANGCKGLNDWTEEGPGLCTAGAYKGCKCASICKGVLNSCADHGCDGMNALNGLNGMCTGGDYVGCLCKSICGKTNGPCSDCDGVDGFCKSGDDKGCPCIDNPAHQCGNLQIGNCYENGCNGVFTASDGFGICQGGENIVGCPCVV